MRFCADRKEGSMHARASFKMIEYCDHDEE